MRKSLITLLALTVLLALCGCFNHSAGNLPPETDPAGSPTVTDPDNPYQNVYDSDGNLLVEYLLDIDGSYLGKTEYTYEGKNCITAKEYGEGNQPILFTSFEYDEDGNLIAERFDYYEDGYVCNREIWEYTAGGLLSAVNYLNKNNVVTDKITYVYDADGNMLKSVGYGYLEGRLFSIVESDPQGNVLSEHQYDEDGNVFWYVLYTYENGLKVKGTESTGCYTIYHYDEGGIEIGYTNYDADGKITEEIYYK